MRNYSTFNVLAVPSSPEDATKLVEGLWVDVCKQNEVSPKCWGTVESLKKNLTKSWEYYDEHFKRYWLDRIVEEYGYMLFNAIKQQAPNDKKVDKKAYNAMQNYLGMFS